MIDGMDDNDDVVGGPLQNISQDAVQEFQVATNRFAAELGRSAALGHQRRDASRAATPMHGSAAVYLRDQSWQALPDDRSTRAWRAIRRSIVSRPRSRSAARSARNELFGFGSLEVTQPGWRRRWSALAIRQRGRSLRSFAPAPLDDLLGTARVDWRAAPDKM